jgi:2-polyprenyl-3-methyl-5-hydroxy-6-metoxy-1,4-benzoquinol methylase
MAILLWFVRLHAVKLRTEFGNKGVVLQPMTSSETARKIASYTNWIQDIEIDGVNTLNRNDPKDYNHINRTKIRRDLFIEPLLRSGFLRGKRVLDLGCSYGYWAMAAASEGEAAEVVGVDAHAPSIEQGKWILERKQIGNCDLRLADSYDTLASIAAGSFDVIFCLGFFYHIRDPFRLLTLMQRAAKEAVIVDTMVHKSDDASISLRPVRPKNLLGESVLSLEMFSSPKAIYWMGLEAGFREVTRLEADFEADTRGLWDYRGGNRASFALSNGPAIASIFDNAKPFEYPTPAEDIELHGIYPELSGGRNGTNNPS